MCFQNTGRRKAHRFVYGDGVAYHSRDSLMAFTWGCTLDFLAPFLKIWKVFWQLSQRLVDKQKKNTPLGVEHHGRGSFMAFTSGCAFGIGPA